MSWYSKEQPTPFDLNPPEGLYFLDGDVLAEKIHQPWTRNQKYPLVVFPSGQECAVWESGDPQEQATIHLFGEMDLPYRGERDRVYEHAFDIAEQCGYMVDKSGEHSLEIWGSTPEEHLLVTYNPETGQMTDVMPLPPQTVEVVHPGHQLMTDELREQLPDLYEGEELGTDAKAQVKYFTPDSNWTWYASEFDGDDLFFGLVVGFEIELGYFSLTELRQARGPMDLPIERDLYFEPRTLDELIEWHRKQRRGDE